MDGVDKVVEKRGVCGLGKLRLWLLQGRLYKLPVSLWTRYGQSWSYLVSLLCFFVLDPRLLRVYPCRSSSLRGQ